MCLLLETIRLEDGNFCYPEYHQARMDRSRTKLFRTSQQLNLQDIPIPNDFVSGIFKCRIIYSESFKQVTFMTYTRKPIKSLVLVNAESIEYSLKFADRSAIERLVRDQIGFDEIIMVKNGSITDTSYSNLVFLSGTTWVTPDEPLLHGTCRQRLLDQGSIITERIKPSDLPQFSHVSLINSMLDLHDLILPIAAIDPGVQY